MSRILFVAALLAAAPFAAQASCSVSARPVQFGVYQPFSTSPTDSTGSVTVRCTSFVGGYTISLGQGGGSYSNRQMRSGAVPLSYQLYSNGTRSSVWGDGASGTVTVFGTCFWICTSSFTTYGRIPARQLVKPGSYVDTIVATVTF